MCGRIKTFCKTGIKSLIYLSRLDVTMKSIHVSLDGRDHEECGTVAVPCRHIRYAAMKSRYAIDEILVHGYHKHKQAVFSESNISLNRSLAIKGIEGRPAILCENCRSILSFGASKTDRVIVFLENLTFFKRKHSVAKVPYRGLIFAQDGSLHIRNCSFIEVQEPVTSVCDRRCEITITNCLFVAPKLGLNIQGSGLISLDVSRSKFLGKLGYSLTAIQYGKSRMISTFFIIANITNCQFTSFGSAVSFYPTSVVVRPVYMVSLYVTNSNFTGNHWSQESSKQGARGSAISLMDSSTNTAVVITGCLFRNNTGIEGAAVALRLIRNQLDANINRCIFESNGVATFGGAISTFSFSPAVFSLNISNNTFLSNWAFYNNKTDVNIPSYDLNSKFGSGGAIAIMQDLCSMGAGSALIVDSYFEDNSAQMIGGTIYAHAPLTIHFSTIKTPRKSRFPSTQGQAIFTSYFTNLYAAHIEIMGSNNGFPVVQFDGPYRSLKMGGDEKIVCPEATILKVYTKRVADLKEDRIQFLSIRCEFCGIGTYSLKKGMFFGLAVTDSKCVKCPSGGICLEGKLKPKENFWGYTTKNGSFGKFTQLPKGYGCTGDLCNRYNSCAAKREGILCGLCRTGFAQSMLSPKCIKNEACNIKKFWLFAAVLLIFYFVFFTFKQEISFFLKRHLFWFKKGDVSTDDSCPYHGLQSGQERVMCPENDGNNDSDILAGLLKIAFYFYQINALFNSSSSQEEKSILNFAKQSIKSVFCFDFLPHGGAWSCAISNATPLWNKIIRLCLIAAVLLVMILAFFIAKLISMVISSKLSKAFAKKVLIALFEVLLLSYTAIATTTFAMLRCDDVNSEKRLHLQGNIICYQKWQIAFMIVGLFWVLPFCGFIFVLPRLLLKKILTLPSLFLGCLSPLAVLLFVFIKFKFRTKKVIIDVPLGDRSPVRTTFLTDDNDETSSLDPVLKAVLTERCKPFTDDINSSKYFSWEGFYILRRLILISIFTFSKDSVCKLYISLFLQICFLLHHVYKKPYKNAKLNLLEMLSLAMLVLINSMDLYSAYGIDHGVREEGKGLILLKVFGWIIAMTVLVPPIILLSILFLLLLCAFGRQMKRLIIAIYSVLKKE